LTKVFISRILINFYNINHISVPARISKGQGAGPEKGSLVRCWIFKKGIF
jgi:hypothetical protein